MSAKTTLLRESVKMEVEFTCNRESSKSGSRKSTDIPM
jgi:hypothetical protein